MMMVRFVLGPWEGRALMNMSEIGISTQVSKKAVFSASSFFQCVSNREFLSSHCNAGPFLTVCLYGRTSAFARRGSVASRMAVLMELADIDGRVLENSKKIGCNFEAAIIAS